MKNLVILFLMLIILNGCKSANEISKDFKSVNTNYIGTWIGELPCADCESISYRLTINDDNTFTESSMYRGKSNEKFIKKGKWEIISQNILKTKADDFEKMFLYADGKLTVLNKDGNEIKSSFEDKYVLTKEEKIIFSAIQQKLLEEGYDFIARGNEPFWSLQIDFQKEMRFSSLTEISNFVTPPTEGMRAQDADVIRYHAVIESGEMFVTIIAGNCTDNMSGEEFTHSVVVQIKRGNDKEFKEFKGCGKYLADYRLNDIWVMTEFAGVKLSKDKFFKGLPTFEFQLKERRLIGHTGCNSIRSSLEIKGNQIQFGKIISTKMACPEMEVENKIIQAISEKSLTYKIKDLTLTLEDDAGNLMLFKKVD